MRRKDTDEFKNWRLTFQKKFCIYMKKLISLKIYWEI